MVKVHDPATKRIQEILLSKAQGKPKAAHSSTRLTRAKSKQQAAVKEENSNLDLNIVVASVASNSSIEPYLSEENWTQLCEASGQDFEDSLNCGDELQELLVEGGALENIRQAAIQEHCGQPFQGIPRRSERISRQASPQKQQNPEQDLNENSAAALGFVSVSGSSRENVDMKNESSQLLVTLGQETSMINTYATPPIFSYAAQSDAEEQSSQVYEDQGAQTPRTMPYETLLIRSPEVLRYDLNQKNDYSRTYFWLWEFGSYCTYKLSTELQQATREIISQAQGYFNDCRRGVGPQKVQQGFQTFETVLNNRFFQCLTCCNFLTNKQKSIHLSKPVSCSSTPAHKLRYPKINEIYICLVCFKNDFEKLYDLICHYLSKHNFEQIRRLGYNTTSLLAYQQDLIQKKLVFQPSIQLTFKTKPLTVEEQKKDARFLCLIQKDDPILKFLEVTTLNFVQRRTEAEPFSVSFLEHQGHLCLTQNKSNFQKGVSNPMGSQVLLQAKRLTAFAESLPMKRKFYLPKSLLDTGDSFGVQISLPLNNRSKVYRYFEKFQDRSHRGDLAFWMLELVNLAEKSGILLRHVWHPDNWLWVESDFFIGAVFIGAYGNRHLSTTFRLWNDTILTTKDEAGDYQNYSLPQREICNQFGDIVVFAMMMVGCHYDDWKPVQGVYVAHALSKKEIVFEDTMVNPLRYDQEMCNRQRSALAFLCMKSYNADATAQVLQALLVGYEAMDPNNEIDREKMTAEEIHSFDFSQSSTITLAHNARVTTIASFGRYRAFRDNSEMFH